MKRKIIWPASEEILQQLKIGEEISLSGIIYSARDAAHLKMVSALKKGGKLPFNIKGSLLYYMGPTPAPPGKIIGSCGPTSSSRMDRLTLPLLQKGLKGMLGKGRRNQEIVQSCKKFKVVYFITFGGCGAYLNKFIKKAELIGYPELGPEAIFRLVIKDFPALVGIDTSGQDFYQIQERRYNKR